MDSSRSNITSVVGGAGIAIRYMFFFTGAIVFGMIALSILKVSRTLSAFSVETVNQMPSFRLLDGDLNRLRQQTKVTAGDAYGRIETRQYGQSYDRSANLTISLIIPPKAGQAFGFNTMRSSLTSAAAYQGSWNANHDLDTRFGSLRTSGTYINADGRIKPCLTFISRFETNAVRLEGAYCEADGTKPSAQALACMLDRLVLDTRLASAEADAFMRGRIARPAQCSADPVTQTYDTRSPRPPPRRY